MRSIYAVKLQDIGTSPPSYNSCGGAHMMRSMDARMPGTSRRAQCQEYELDRCNRLSVGQGPAELQADCRSPRQLQLNICQHTTARQMGSGG